MTNKKNVTITTIFMFSISSFLIFIGIYFFIPYFMNKGLLFAEAYLFCFHTGFVFLLIGAFILYKKEGNKFTISNFSDRLRLRKINKKEFKILILFFFITFIGFYIAYLTGNFIAQRLPFLQPDFLPAELNVNKDFQMGYFFDIKLKGQWWFAFIYTIGWLINIFGEEFLFRGMLYPLHEKYYGSKAWLIHAILWGFWHIFWMWSFIPIMLFMAIPLLLATRLSKNTWVPIIIHGSLNIIQIIYIYSQVI